RLQHQRRQQHEENAEEPSHGGGPPLHALARPHHSFRASARSSLSVIVSNRPRWSRTDTEVGCSFVAGSLQFGWAFVIGSLWFRGLLPAASLRARKKREAQANCTRHRH